MGWSPWQDGELVLTAIGATPAPDTNFHTADRTFEADSPAFGTDDVAALVEQAREAALANSAGTVDPGDVLLPWGIATTATPSTDKADPDLGANPFGAVQFQTGCATFFGDALSPDDTFDWFPPLLDTLTEGVDYSVRPDRSPGDEDAYVQYDTGTPVFEGWANWNPVIRLFGSAQLNDHFIPDTTTSIPWQLKFSWAHPLADLTGWHDLSDGTLINDATVDPAVSSSGVLVDIHPTVSLDALGTGLPLNWSILLHNSNFTDAFEGSDYAAPASGSGLDYADGYLLQAMMFLAFHSGLPSPILPQIKYQLPRWRYWIPDNIYTVGGHWSDPNGVVVKRLKDDGVTWIPIVDGLAPPLR